MSGLSCGGVRRLEDIGVAGLRKDWSGWQANQLQELTIEEQISIAEARLWLHQRGGNPCCGGMLPLKLVPFDNVKGVLIVL